MLKKFLALSSCALSVLITSSLAQPASAQRETPITRISFSRADNTSMTAELVVPNEYIKQANKNGLRPYDTHIAKIVEVSDYLCQKDQNLMRLNWQYSANQGSTPVNTFNVPCSFARDIAKGYGLKSAVHTQLWRDNRFSEIHSIPTLNIFGEKTTTWLRVADDFKQLTDLRRS